MFFYRLHDFAAEHRDEDGAAFGSIRSGDCCFDFLLRHYNDDNYKYEYVVPNVYAISNIRIDVDVYIGGVEGYGDKNGYPYDFWGTVMGILPICRPDNEVRLYSEEITASWVNPSEEQKFLLNDTFKFRKYFLKEVSTFLKKKFEDGETGLTKLNKPLNLW